MHSSVYVFLVIAGLQLGHLITTEAATEQTSAAGQTTTAAPGQASTAAPGQASPAAPSQPTAAGTPGQASTAAPSQPTAAGTPGQASTAAGTPGQASTAAPGQASTAAPGQPTAEPWQPTAAGHGQAAGSTESSSDDSTQECYHHELECVGLLEESMCLTTYADFLEDNTSVTTCHSRHCRIRLNTQNFITTIKSDCVDIACERQSTEETMANPRVLVACCNSPFCNNEGLLAGASTSSFSLSLFVFAHAWNIVSGVITMQS
ncbi:uncharacterized protein LOC143283801 isoform X1 [Babylonia areolata]|uniref:uncharacterized protein LOC143283801 isoform X1 n=1 Tax=Babylonia areolata TaxID=304850 RepID=UPI003FD6B613